MMSEKLLLSLMRFYAVFLRVASNINLEIAKSFVISFLQSQFNEDIVGKYTSFFTEYYNDPNIETSAYFSLTQNQVKNFSNDIIVRLPFKQRIFLIINLLSFTKFLSTTIADSTSYNTISGTIDKVALLLKIKSKTYSSLKFFVKGKYHEILDYDIFLIITGLVLEQKSKIKKHFVRNLEGQFFVLRFDFEFFLICYKGNEDFYLNEKLILQDNLYIISYHSNISSEETPTIYFNDLLKTFLRSYEYPEIKYSANNIEYNFTNKLKGIHPFSFECRQNEMVGIIGSSGVGKSTLLKLLAGILSLHAGEIQINNHDLNPQNREINDLIGYIPQEEVLFENLTVFENIWFHAKLSMKNGSENGLNNRISELLENLGLYDVKDYKVGTISRKIISGGERKRLNIALELIRNPYILFIDEPTSGLSSSDAEKILNLLKQQALKGKLIFINVHQPSDQILHLFDKLIVIDKGGFPVYFGPMGDAYKYLVEKSNIVSAQKLNKAYSESEKILEIIEGTTVDEFGNPTTKRETKPIEWYQYFRKHQLEINPQTENKQELDDTKETTPTKHVRTFEKPSRIFQFLIYLTRNYKTRIANSSYVFISLFVSPILAAVLAFFCKQMTLVNLSNFEYLFNKNENIPSFIFMSIIVALFVGLMTGAEEIIKDKRILLKEAFLNLSSLRYLSSKISYLIIMSLIQTFTYSIIGYAVLKFNSGFLTFWLTLLSISFIANICGLIISTLFNTTVAVYILIPFIIIPQILLSGIVVKFDNINPNFTSPKYTPVISDIMPTRWAYELLMVDQFKNNKYQRHLFDIEKQISDLNFKILVIIPELRSRVNEMTFAQLRNDSIFKGDVLLVMHELNKLSISRDSKSLLTKGSNGRKAIDNILANKKLLFAQRRDSLYSQKDLIFRNLIDQFNGRENLNRFKDLNFNNSIAKTLLDKESFEPFIIWKNQIIRKTDPVYKVPESPFGRAHFFASQKKIGRLKIQTVKFNLMTICIQSFILILLSFILFRNKYKF